MNNRIKKLRKQHGLTQEQLAKRLGFNRTQAGKWKLGINEPNLQTLFRLADMFGVTVEYLYCHD